MIAKSRGSSFQSDADEARSMTGGDGGIIDHDKADNYSTGRRVGNTLIERILRPARAINGSRSIHPLSISTHV